MIRNAKSTLAERFIVTRLIVFFWMLFSIPLKAQPPSLSWGFGMGGTGNLSYMVNGVNDLDIGLHGQLIAGGIIGGTIDLNPSADTFSVVSGTPTLFNGFVGRYSAQGAFLSGYAFNSPSQVIITAVACDSIGRIYVAGTYNSSMDVDPGNGTFTLSTANGDWNVFIAAMDSSGQLIYSLNLGGLASNDKILDMKCDEAGNVYITGSITDVADLDPATPQGNFTGSNSGNMYLAKYAADGQYLWGMMIPSNSFGHEGHSLSIASNGNVFVGLQFRGLIDIDPSANVVIVDDIGARDILVAEFTPTGNYVQSWQIGGPGGVTLDKISVVCAPLGRVYVCSKFNGTLDVDPGPGSTTYNSTNQSNCFVGAYSSTGQLLWSAVPGFMPTGSQSMDVDDQGGVYLNVSEMVDEARVVKYDVNGTQAYQLNFSGNIYGYCIKTSGVNTFYTGGSSGVSGQVNGTLIGGSGTGYRALLCRFSSCLPPVILGQSSSLSACVDAQVTLNVTATGTGLTYQWYKNNVLMPGATNSDLELSNVSFADTGSYHCMISGDCGVQMTSPIILSVNANPVASIMANGSTLEAYPAFPPVYNYDWLLNGQSTGVTLPFMPNPGPGSHQVVVVSADGCIDTSAAFIITGEDHSAGTVLRLYPNPAEDLLFVEGIAAGVTQYQIASADGRIKRNVHLANFSGLLNIDTSELVPGYYQIEFADRNGPLIRLPFLKSH